MLIVLTLMLQVPEVPSIPTPAQPCRLRAPSGKLINVSPKLCEQSTWDDLALRMQREGGKTVIAFELDESGRVENCRIDRSSGHPELDAKACAIAAAKAQYTAPQVGPIDRRTRKLTVSWNMGK